MIHSIHKICAIEEASIHCLFNTGEIRRINIADVLGNDIHNPFYSLLLQPNYFKSVKLDSYGTLCWENEIDFCPDVLYQLSVPSDIIQNCR